MTDQNKKELKLTRVFDAPRELIFDAWTDQNLTKKWWGPRGVTTPTCEIDAQPGGKIDITMVAGEELGELKGQEWPMTGTFKEIVRPTKLVFTSAAIMHGKPILESLVTVTFEEQDAKTKMIVHIVVTKAMPEAEGPLKGMQIGWSQSLDKLGETLQRLHGGE